MNRQAIEHWESRRGKYPNPCVPRDLCATDDFDIDVDSKLIFDARTKTMRNAKKVAESAHAHEVNAKSGADFEAFCHAATCSETAFLPPKPEGKLYTYPLLSQNYNPDHQVTHIDWLRFTLRGVEYLHVAPELFDLLEDILPDLELKRSTTKILGYSEVWTLNYWQDNQLHSLGYIGLESSSLASHAGLMCDLTGVGCGLIKQSGRWRELVDWISYFGARITRADVALDVCGDYARKNGITVPSMMRRVSNGFLSTPKTPASYVPAMATLGDWSDILLGNATLDNYNPATQGRGGLTLNVGTRAGSARYYRFYEKGKQILGKMAEPDADVDMHWLRLECEFKREKTQGDIPYELLLESDAWLCSNRPELFAFVQDYRLFLCGDDADSLVMVFKKTVALSKSLLLTRKVFFARRQYGRLVNTLLTEGFDHDKVIKMIIGSKGLKDYIYDFDDLDNNDLE